MDNEMTINSATEELNEIITKMENGNLTMEEGMECYEDACKLFEFCFTRLHNYKLRMIEINEKLSALQQLGEPYEE